MTAIVTTRHLRMAGICSRGARAFALQQGIDYDDFLKNGMSVIEMRKYNTEQARDVADIAEAEYRDRERAD